MRICPPRSLTWALPALAWGLALAVGCAGAEVRSPARAAHRAPAPAVRRARAAPGTSWQRRRQRQAPPGTTLAPREPACTGRHRHQPPASAVPPAARRGDRQRRHDRRAAGTTGSGGTTGAGGSISTGSGGTTGASGTGGICQQAQIVYVPKTPTALPRGRSLGSMFHCLSTSELVCSTKSDTSWSKLKTAIETVITQLDSQVRFGFTTIFGTNPAGGGLCPLLTGHAGRQRPRRRSSTATAIKAKYDSPRHHVAEPERRHEHRQEVRIPGERRR